MVTIFRSHSQHAEVSFLSWWGVVVIVGITEVDLEWMKVLAVECLTTSSVSVEPQEGCSSFPGCCLKQVWPHWPWAGRL